MDCFSFADKVMMLIFGFISSIALTTLYFTLLFAIKISIQQRRENIRQGQRTKNREE